MQDTIEAVTGYRPEGCPWWAFHVPGVSEVLSAAYTCSTPDGVRAAMLLPSDPEQRILEGVKVYARALAAVRDDDARRRAEDARKSGGQAHGRP